MCDKIIPSLASTASHFLHVLIFNPVSFAITDGVVQFSVAES